MYLLVYTVLRWGGLRLRPRLLDSAAALLQQALAGARLWWLPVALLAALRIALIDRFPPTHALIDDLYLHASHFAFFIGGAAMARMAPPWPRFERARWASLALALAGWLVMILAHSWWDFVGDGWVRSLARTGFATTQWFAALAALGFAYRHWNREFAGRRLLTEAVFPVYIVHQTIIVMLAVALAPWALPAAVEAVLLVGATLGLSLACYAAVRHLAWLRPGFGLEGRRKAAAPAGLHP